jgi:hypothetical protein
MAIKRVGNESLDWQRGNSYNGRRYDGRVRETRAEY